MPSSAIKKMTAIFPVSYWREILAILMLLLAFIFFRSERKELKAIIPHIQHADPFWLLAGFVITIFYFVMQGGTYRKSFAAIGLSLKLSRSVTLFLKRNFASVFLPAGGVASLAYTPSQIRKSGFSKTKIHQASALFAFAGLITTFIAGLPVVVYNIFSTGHFKNAWIGLLILLLLITGLFFFVKAIKTKRAFYHLVKRKFPFLSRNIDELFATNVDARKFSGAIIYSIGVECCGIVHIYIAMLALGVVPSFAAAVTAYIISVLLMAVSPFLRGLGAVELSVVYVLGVFGYNPLQSFAITILYRVFEFWLPLFAGFLAFAWKGKNLFLRVTPVLVTFLLGVINIISSVKGPQYHRLYLLREYIPLTAIHASHILVLFTGLALLVTSAFLFRGLRSAWIIAFSLSIVSLIGHLSKAPNYDEAAFAAITISILAITAGQYRRRSSQKWMQAGIKTAALSFAAFLVFGCIGFYFIDKIHFGIDFTWQQSLLYSLKSFMLVEDESLHPVTHFGHEFIWIIRVAGFATWSFLIFTVIKPYLYTPDTNESSRDRARLLASQYGNSSTDYFKLYKDKRFFFSEFNSAFIAYRVAGGFAIVLGEPVCAEQYKARVVEEFDRYCRKSGLRVAFYRVDETSIPLFENLQKQKLMIGQEAILDINSFTLEGKDKKSLRNALSSIQKKGYSIIIHEAPHTEKMLAELETVSNEWLRDFGKKEMQFSQGIFDANELQNQDIIAIHDTEGSIKTFLNIIPDFSPGECTYDLIRRTNDAPGGAMDVLIITLIEYARKHKKRYINLGMAPMSGISQPANIAEQLLKLAGKKMKRFRHYQGLREFKEKYASFWENKYLVYENDFDLLQLPVALNNVMKP